jgi:hypothetical protein
MACKSCAERRKKLQVLRDAKKLKRQGAQAAALGVVLAVTEAAGKVLGINGEEDNEKELLGTDDGIRRGDRE